MASTQPNNAPFISTQNFPAVRGVSNSPFTDERAVAAGGSGPQPGTGGNMVFTPTAPAGPVGTVTYESPATGTPITQIDNALLPLTISSNDNVQIAADVLFVGVSSTGNIAMGSTTPVTPANFLGNDIGSYDFAASGDVAGTNKQPIFRLNGGVGENTNYFTVGNTPAPGTCLGWDGTTGNGTVGSPYQCSWVPANTSYNNTDLKLRRLVAQVPDRKSVV